MTGSLPTVVFMLLLRITSFALLQLLLAAAFAATGSSHAIADAAAWWLWIATVVNVACIALLLRLSRADRDALRALYVPNRATVRGDLKWLGLMLVVSGPIAMLPNFGLGALLFGDFNIPGTLLFQPLPLAAVIPLLLVMPVTQGLAELPTYWGYVAPRLLARGAKKAVVVVVVGSVLGLQHATLGFLLDWRFNVWHGLMFLPFALWTGVLLVRRPTLMPYMVIVHMVIDATLPISLLSASW